MKKIPLENYFRIGLTVRRRWGRLKNDRLSQGIGGFGDCTGDGKDCTQKGKRCI